MDPNGPLETAEDTTVAGTSAAADARQLQQIEPQPDRDAAALAALSTTMGPDHPLLQRAQRALKQQLETKRTQLDGELKEKRNALKVGSDSSIRRIPPPKGSCLQHLSAGKRMPLLSHAFLKPCTVNAARS
jgi:hypothetical protein